MKYKTSELEGAYLDHAVFIALRDAPGSTVYGGPFQPSEDLAVGGQIVEREKITIRWREPNAVKDTGYWAAMKDADSPQPGAPFWMVGPTFLIAAMRAFVAAKIGQEVDL